MHRSQGNRPHLYKRQPWSWLQQLVIHKQLLYHVKTTEEPTTTIVLLTTTTVTFIATTTAETLDTSTSSTLRNMCLCYRANDDICTNGKRGGDYYKSF